MSDHPSHNPSSIPANVSTPPGHTPADAVQEYAALARELQDDSLDETAHQLDKKIAWVMANYSGRSPADIKHAMRAASLHLARHGGDAQSYVDRTVDEALTTDPFEGTTLGWGV